jgi:hypothetical protein
VTPLTNKKKKKKIGAHPVRSIQEEVTVPVQSGAEEVTVPVQSDSEEVTVPVQSDAEEVTVPVQSGVEEVTVTVQSGAEEVTAAVQSGQEELTVAVKSRHHLTESLDILYPTKLDKFESEIYSKCTERGSPEANHGLPENPDTSIHQPCIHLVLRYINLRYI